jgi:hypothetical protein
LFFFYVGVVYSGEYDVCDVTLSVYPHRVGSNPTVARHIFQACPVWIYTQSNITNIRSHCVMFLSEFMLICARGHGD